MRILMGVATLLWATVAFGEEFPEITGWQPAGEVGIYGRDNLWEYINGGAEQYLTFGFQELRHRDLACGELVFAVHLYDMGTPLGAFGIYTIERPELHEALSIGVEAIVLPPYQALMLKGHFYVKVEAYKGEIDPEAGAAILRAVAGVLPGEGRWPVELGRLPQDQIVPGSERWAPRSFLGLRELTNCLYATWSAGHDTDARVFLLLPNPGEDSAAVWEALSTQWRHRESRGHEILLREVPYQGYAGVVRCNDLVLGLVGFAKEKDLIEQLALLAAVSCSGGSRDAEQSGP